MEQAPKFLRKSLLSFEKIPFPVPPMKQGSHWIIPYKHYIFYFLYSEFQDGSDCVVFNTQKGTMVIIKSGIKSMEKANASLCYWKDNIFVLYGGLKIIGNSQGSKAIRFVSVIENDGQISFKIEICKPMGGERPDKDHYAHIHQDQMYIIGNKTKSVQFETIPTFDLNTRTWAEQPTTKDIPEPCQNPTSVLFNGKIYFFGGTTPPPPEDVKAQAAEDIKPQAKEDMKPQAAEDMKPQAKEDVKPQAAEDVKPQAAEDMKPQAAEDMKPQAKEDVKPQAAEDMKPQAKEDVKPQAAEDMKPQAAEDMKPQAKEDVKPQAKEDVKPQAAEDMKPQAKEDVKPQQTAGSDMLSNISSGGAGARPGSLFGNKGSTGGSCLFGSQLGAGSLFGSQTGVGGSGATNKGSTGGIGLLSNATNMGSTGGSGLFSNATKMGSTGGSSLFGSQLGAGSPFGSRPGTGGSGLLSNATNKGSTGGSGLLSNATNKGSTGGSGLFSNATKMGSTGGSSLFGSQLGAGSLFGSQTGVGGSGLLANATNKGSIGGISFFPKRVALDLFVLDLETMEWQQIHKQSFLPTCPTSIRDYFFAEAFGDKIFISHRNLMQSFIYDPANNNTLNSEGLSFKDLWRLRSFGEHSLLFRILIENNSSWLEYHNLAQPQKQEEKITTSQQLSEPQLEKQEDKITTSQQLSEPQPEKQEEKVTTSPQLSEPKPEKKEEKVTSNQKPPEMNEKPSAERNESLLQARSEILRRSLLSLSKAPFPRVELTYTAAYKHFLIIFTRSKTRDGGDCVILDTEKGTTQTLQTGLQLPKRFNQVFSYWKDNIFVFYGGHFSEDHTLSTANPDLDVHLLYVIENQGKISIEAKSCHLTDPKWWVKGKPIHIYQDNMYILSTQKSSHYEVLNKFDLNKEEWSECQTTGEIPIYYGCDRQIPVLLNGKIYIFAPKVEEATLRRGGSSLFGEQARNPESWILFALDLENYKWQQIHKDSSIPTEVQFSSFSKVVGDRIFKSHQNYVEFWIYNPANNQVLKSEGFRGREDWRIESFRNHFIIFKITSNFFRCEIEYQNIAISAQPQQEEKKTSLSDPMVDAYQQLPHMEYLWKAKPFADITFVVTNEEIQAHRVILLKCRYFQNMFKSGMIEANSNKINVPDISPANFKAILEYIYLDKITLTEALAMELIILADMYSLPNLKADCEIYLAEILSVSNFVEVMKVAQTADSEKLEKRIVSFLTSNIEKVKQEIDISVIPPGLFIKAIVDLKSNKK